MVYIKILLLQLFWFSFLLIGFAELSLLPKKQEYTKRLHWLVKTLFAFVMGFASLGFIVAPAFFLEWPIVTVQVFYTFLLITSASLLLRVRKPTIGAIKYPKQLSARVVMIVVIIGSVLGGNYLQQLKNGAVTDGDAKFEIAQITLFSQAHLGLTDPIFGAAGTPPTAFSVSIQHAAQAVAASFFDESAVWVWHYSGAFFQLLFWISLFALSWEFLAKNEQRSWSYALLAILPIYYGNVFIYPELHNQVVFIWAGLLIIAVKIWLQHRQVLPLLAPAILLSSAHPLSAFIAAAFICLLVLTLAIFRLVKSKDVYPMVGLVILLLLPMALYLYYPHGITDAGFFDHGAARAELLIRKIGPVYFNTYFAKISITQIFVTLLLGALLILSKHIKRFEFRLSLVVLGCISFILVISATVLSSIGYAYLFFSAKGKQNKILVLLLVIFSSLVTHNPVILTLFHDALPQWAIARFQDFNTLSYIAPLLGLFCIVVLPLRYVKADKLVLVTLPAAALFAITVLPLLISHPWPLRIEKALLKQPESKYLQFYAELAELTPSLKNQLVISDDHDRLSFIPAVMPVSVFSIGNEANTHPAVHIKARKQCVADIVSKPSLQGLQNTGATRLLITPNSSESFRSAIQSLPGITLMQSHAGYSVYNTAGERKTFSNLLC